ncbi:MAG: UDP-galactopyranose mutase [Calditrichaeota bacterium]|nr:UDP-galactopyranose mutase [Calditrichota bacterium]
MKILIVGAGLYGATVARLLSDAGHDVLVIERRDHTAGNCYSYNLHGIEVHRYGPHIFHTSIDQVWRFANRYASFLGYHHSVKSKLGDRLYSIPINLNTMKDLWGITTPDEAKAKLNEARVHIPEPANMEEWALSKIGEQLYELFVKPYTIKQWNKHPRELPPFILKRLPVRFSFNDSYFDDKWTGIPEHGYTAWIDAMLEAAPVELETDFFDRREEYERRFDKIFYTGRLDRFFDYRYGPLEYRSLRFEVVTHDIEDYQGASIINYPELKYEFTRKIEHKHLTKARSDKTVVTTEYPQNWTPEKTPFYPVNTDENNRIGAKYKALAERISSKYIFGGRLADYKYYDMDKTISAALNQIRRLDGSLLPRELKVPESAPM